MFPKEPKKITERFGFVGGNALQVILDKLPDAVTESERDILRARKSYLTEEQIKRFGLEEPVEIAPEPAPPEPPTEIEEELEVKRGRKSKK